MLGSASKSTSMPKGEMDGGESNGRSGRSRSKSWFFVGVCKPSRMRASIRCASRSATSMVFARPSARTLGSAGPPSQKGFQYFAASVGSGFAKQSISGSSSNPSSAMSLHLTLVSLDFTSLGGGSFSFSPPVKTRKASRVGLGRPLASRFSPPQPPLCVPGHCVLDKSPRIRLSERNFCGITPCRGVSDCCAMAGCLCQALSPRLKN
mmetsp:Transcript_74434/g.150518  ORF Transcript_74434/g.150518 Transcript_74434/m.150518 type:complete len:207 (-) Transcript_74434:16-636(-)